MQGEKVSFLGSYGGNPNCKSFKYNNLQKNISPI
jgi:hypothetical protein